jgi:hypothetical protein
MKYTAEVSICKFPEFGTSLSGKVSFGGFTPFRTEILRQSLQDVEVQGTSGRRRGGWCRRYPSDPHWATHPPYCEQRNGCRPTWFPFSNRAPRAGAATDSC